MTVFEDDLYHEIMTFLDAAEEHGKGILTVIDQQGQNTNPKYHNVAFEARLLKRTFLKLHGQN
eukprot:1032835-Amorphochlora_amoeboformis.AAC.2